MSSTTQIPENPLENTLSILRRHTCRACDALADNKGDKALRAYMDSMKAALDELAAFPGAVADPAIEAALAIIERRKADTRHWTNDGAYLGLRPCHNCKRDDRLTLSPYRGTFAVKCDCGAFGATERSLAWACEAWNHGFHLNQADQLVGPNGVVKHISRAE